MENRDYNNNNPNNSNNPVLFESLNHSIILQNRHRKSVDVDDTYNPNNN